MKKEIKNFLEAYKWTLREADEQPQNDDEEQQVDAQNSSQPNNQRNAENNEDENQQGDSPKDSIKVPKGETPTEQVTPANAQAVSNEDALNPGTLKVADGTDTGIELSTNIVSNKLGNSDGSLPPKEGQIDIKFEQGNFSTIESSAQNYSQLIKTLDQTMVPLVEKAFIELLGNSASYKRQSFNAVPTMNGQNIKIDVDMIYHVEKYIAVDVAPELIKKDQDYIINTIKVTPGMSIRNVQINCQTGDVNIGVTLSK